MKQYLYLTNLDKINIIEDAISSRLNVIERVSNEKDLILSGGNSQRSIRGIDYEIQVNMDSISVLNAKKNELI